MDNGDFKQIDEVDGGFNLTIGEKKIKKRAKRQQSPIFDEPIVERTSISPPPDTDKRYKSRIAYVMFKQSVKG
jgi:hypothetical protein